MRQEPETPLRISVIGCGYLGTVHAAAMASLGHEVIGIDTDKARVEKLGRGEAPFFEPGLDAQLAASVQSGRLTFTTDLADAAHAEVHFICVGTPQVEDGDAADLRALFAVCESLAPILKPGMVVAGKSTVPVGTAERLAPAITATGATLVWNPEFLREGHALSDTLSPDRIVIGTESGDASEATSVLEQVYASPLAAGTPLIVTDLPTAELVKGAANSYLATRLSFVNALAEVADAAGADISKLTEALGYDSRIGSQYLRAGIGFGGGCLPKDIRAFAARSHELGALGSASLLEQVDAINLRQRDHTLELAQQMLGGQVAGHKITVLGAAFKPDSDDVRDSPALDLAASLHRAGAIVTVTDPAAVDNAAARRPELSFETNIDVALRHAELVIIATEWPEYRGLDPAQVAGIVSAMRVLDGRNCIDPVAWKLAGWTYRGIGRR